MAENTNNRLTRMLLSKSRRAQYLKVFAVLAACVVVAVAMVLHQNGVAMTHKEQVLTCPVTGTVAHTHDQSCYDKDGNLVCTLPERELHVHDDSCYTETRTLICGQEESDEHQHTDACYNVSRDLTCGKEEVTEEHVHGPGCFTTVTVQDADDSDNANAGDAEATVQPSANTTEGAAASQSALPAQSFTGLVKDQNDKVVLQVEVTAPEGAFPANTTMKIAAIDSKDVKDTVDKAVTQKSADEVVKDIQAVDITFFNEAGQEIEPLCPITVSMMSDKIANENTNPVLVHVDDEGKGEVVDQLSDKQAAERNVETSDNTLAFDANAFSVYVIAYTVDFHYDVDGETYDFSIPGGGFVSLTDLIEVLGVAEGANSEGNAANPEESTGEDALTLSGIQVSDKTRKFVADVESVQFSSPDLVWVGKIESDSTVGGLKEANGLDVQYSAELTKEQIEQINAQTVKGGDWVLISKLPFLSEESLTVTMKNGEVFTIKVTDAQLKQTVISKSGETWEITVTYDDSAKIPNGAELKVTEITKDSSEYSNIRQSIKENVDGKTEDITGVPILFDISIWNGDQEIEPAEGSQVQVEVKLVSDAVKGMYTAEDSPLLIDELPVNGSQAKMTKEMKVLHLKEDKKIDLVESTDTISEGETVSSFTTDSFSNWLLYLDEDLTSINVTTGDSITLRPYSEWIWKKTDELDEYKGGQWTFPNSEWSTSTQNGFTYYTHKINGSQFRSFEKTDDQLNETYIVVTSVSLNAGTFNLQTNKEKTIQVNVTQGQASGKPKTVPGIEGLTVNLFDYDVPYVNGQPDFKRSGNLDVEGNKATTPINETVNIGHDLKFLGWGYDGANHGVNSYTQENPVQGVVKDRLGTDGFPVLNTNQSLKYLFDTNPVNSSNSSVYAFPNADGLFQQDNQGYYYYNSNSNYAEYDIDSNKFKLYEHTYSQNTGGSNGANAKPIGFFPFHEYDTTETQPSMNHNKKLNHHFGISMAVDFEIPQDRRAPDLNGVKHDIIYEFSGDDDLWVFIDDDLVLDIGGLHQPVTGTINFTTGVISVHGVKDKTMTFEVGSHTLKMFYLERGGCDSNLSVRFNLPLILGKGSVRVVKKSNANDQANADTPLVGALFGIWENPNCVGEPYTIVTSDQNGVISKDLPIRKEGQEEGQKFYMKEIAPPGGYLLNHTIFTLTAGDLDVNGNCEFEISSGDVAISDSDATLGYPIIRNQAVAPIDIEVTKEWQRADGTPMTEVPDTATFAVKRTRTYSADPVFTVVMRSEQNADKTFDTILAHAGDILTIKYRHHSDSRGTTAHCSTANKVNNVLDLPTNETGDEISVNYTVNENHASNGKIEILIPDWFTNWCNGSNYSGGYNPIFVGVQTTSHNMVTEIDSNYDEDITLTSQNDWKATLNDLIVQKNIGGTLYHYEYYVVEKDVPDGYVALYSDANNPEPSSQATNISGTQTVVNKQLGTNITLKKVAKDQLDAPNPQTLTNAAFSIEKYQSDDYLNMDTSWGNNGKKDLTDVNKNGEFSIEGLSTGFYKIVETKCPDGYIKCSEDPTFKVEMNDTTKELEIVLPNSNQSEFVKYNKNDATLLYGNEPGTSLPETGGSGTKLYTILGSMLVAGAGAMLVMKKRRSAE